MVPHMSTGMPQGSLHNCIPATADLMVLVVDLATLLNDVARFLAETWRERVTGGTTDQGAQTHCVED
jgi:hypothetical protein